MSPQPAITVSGGGRDKGGRGIAVMINDYLAFSTDIDLVERTLTGKSWDRGDKMGGGRRPRSSHAARGTIHCVGESVNEHLALKTYSASSSAYVRVGSGTGYRNIHPESPHLGVKRTTCSIIVVFHVSQGR